MFLYVVVFVQIVTAHAMQNTTLQDIAGNAGNVLFRSVCLFKYCQKFTHLLHSFFRCLSRDLLFFFFTCSYSARTVTADKLAEIHQSVADKQSKQQQLDDRYAVMRERNEREQREREEFARKEKEREAEEKRKEMEEKKKETEETDRGGAEPMDISLSGAGARGPFSAMESVVSGFWFYPMILVVKCGYFLRAVFWYSVSKRYDEMI